MKQKLMLVMVLTVLVPLTLTARGNSEKPYGIILDEEFTTIVTALEDGEIDLPAAIDQLHELRRDNNRPDSAEYREMEKIMEAVQTKEMSTLQAREKLHQLEESDCDMTETQLRTRDKLMTKQQDQTGDTAGTPVKNSEAPGSNSDTSKNESRGNGTK